MDLMEGVSNSQYHLYPYLAVNVVEAAREGDPAACDVMKWAGEELGWLGVAVARQIDMQDEEVEIIQSGSVFEAGDLIMKPMREMVSMHCPRAKLIRLDGPPVVGAVILGMEQIGFNGYAIRANIIRTAKELVR
jgi:N-acetylglucosamine kinase-like BadF-type ATPase